MGIGGAQLSSIASRRGWRIHPRRPGGLLRARLDTRRRRAGEYQSERQRERARSQLDRQRPLEWLKGVILDIDKDDQKLSR